MTKLNITSELFITGRFRKPKVPKNLFGNNYEREKCLYLQFHKRYDSTWVVTTDFCSINLVEEEANKTPRDTVFIYGHFMRRRIEKIRMRSNIHHLYMTVVI